MADKNVKSSNKSDKKRKLLTMNVEIVYVFVIAFIIGCIGTLLISFCGEKFIENKLMSEKSQEKRASATIQSFADYVEENSVASTDSKKLDEWSSEHKNIVISIIRENDDFLKSPPISGWSYSHTDSETEDFELITDENSANSETSGDPEEIFSGTEASNSESASNGGNSFVTSGNTVYSNYDMTAYPVNFSDGIYAVTVTDYSDSTYYVALSYVEIIALIIFSVIVLVVFTNTLIKRIKSLSRQVSEVTAGNLDTEVAISGRDELYVLANEINGMRSSLVDKIKSEQTAWVANQELITSISHDIRNPLTTLIGYSDMLVNKQYTDDEQFERYLSTCRDKAYQLKDMTDEMFRYFLVFGTPEVKVNKETENARILFEQLLGEPTAELKMKGYNIISSVFTEDKYISVDIVAVKRIFDNLISNIRKYADDSKPISIIASVEGNSIFIKLVNFIREDKNPVESTKIGIKTCESLCKALSVGYKYYEENNSFITEMRFPIIDIGEV